MKTMHMLKRWNTFNIINGMELFNAIRSSQITFNEAKNKQNDFLNKLTNIRIVRTRKDS